MSIRKRNEFLDQDNSEDEGADGYRSDDLEEGRGAIGGHASKRRKVESEDESDDGAYPIPQSGKDARFDTSAFGNGDEDAEILLEQAPDDDEDDLADDIERVTKRPTPKSVSKAEKAARKSGVIYISRVPPFMKPHTLKHFLEPHAPKGLGRIFLTPEDHANYLQRKKSGGNKKKSFTDGWIEFTSKSDAKVAASVLNGNIIGGKKGGYYHDDLWNMKYLKGFKWSHLTEQIAAENAERDVRMREEIRRTRKENKAFLEDVERGKMLEGMEAKRKAKGITTDEEASSKGKGRRKRPGMEFRQMKVQVKGARSKDADQPDVQRTLSMIF
jgi:ESF2/ABP1 family protein